MLSPAVIAWLEFSLCAALIAVAGTRLSRYGDVIADKTGLGGAWIGLALMATGTLRSVTSSAPALSISP
jgi:cation:H+ antiporter